MVDPTAGFCLDQRMTGADSTFHVDLRGVLATIGASTTRDALGLARESFLGQFGIGLLSCDGTYAVSPAPEPRAEPGTDVAIRPRGSAAELLSAAVVERPATTFAGYLHLELVVETPDGPVAVAGRAFPWEDGEGAAGRAAITRAEDIAVLNAGYAYDRLLLDRWVARTRGLESLQAVLLVGRTLPALIDRAIDGRTA